MNAADSHRGRCDNGAWCCDEHAETFERACVVGRVIVEWTALVSAAAVAEIVSILGLRR